MTNRITVNLRMSRAYTIALMCALEEGFITKDVLIEELMRWLSEDQVREFCEGSLVFRDEDNDSIFDPINARRGGDTRGYGIY